MRVITPFGLGRVQDWGTPDQSTADVKLDASWGGTRMHTLDKRSEIFRFTPFAVVRVLNVSVFGWLSNLQFQDSRAVAREFLFHFTPPDETTFFLDFGTGHYEVNRERGAAVERYVWMRPWIDRWAPERSEMPSDLDSALKLFEREKNHLAGSSGLASSLLLDSNEKRILRFFITAYPALGIIVEKNYI